MFNPQRLQRLSSLVFIDHKNGKLVSSTLSAISAASSLGQTTAFIASSNPLPIAQLCSQIPKLTSIVTFTDPSFEHALPEKIAPLLKEYILQNNITHVCGPHSSSGKNIFPRLAALLNVSQISDITAIDSQDTFQRPIYAGSAIATIKSTDSIKVFTVRSTAFEPAQTHGGSAVIVEGKVNAHDGRAVEWIKEELAKSDRPELGGAKIVIGGGRGLSSGENFKMLYDLADKLGGAAVGASRAAVDAGYVSNDLQIGQTGKIVAPEVYIAVGISGAIQHLAGMKDSKTIVAINKDAEAPIFQVADFGLVGDLFKIIPEMTEKIVKK